MTRRDFISGATKALAAFAILPAATQYTRLWKAVSVPKLQPNPDWVEHREWFVFYQSLADGTCLKTESVEIKGVEKVWKEIVSVSEWKINMGNVIKSV